MFRWSVVVPVKRVPAAKTRLYGSGRPLPPREQLVLALAADTVRAALRSEVVARVVVVTDEPDARVRLESLGAMVVGDEPDAGLNPALRHGAAAALQAAPSDGVAVLASDLPALRSAELTAALGLAEKYPRAFVSDASGVGTALLAVSRPPLDPRYGGPSRAAHLESGAVELPGGWPSLQRDVDTVEDLDEAARLGLGPATRSVLERVSRQATVRNFDPASGSGDALLDDGSVAAFDGTAFTAGGLRLLRLGQRVRLEYSGEHVVRLTLLTLP
ncbi:MAG TPA: 2-phospho-L-lactate guanylyltransferase [Mycobacteriales bacterium]|nr:2-phospho-L-lactate guanylyltransferase [Mycobacteriales bacterium]